LDIQIGAFLNYGGYNLKLQVDAHQNGRNV